jgi:hypothetical protein
MKIIFMKFKQKIFAFIFSLLFIHVMYADIGPNVWTTSLSGVGDIRAIAINSVDSNVIFAGSNTLGVWKTANSGIDTSVKIFRNLVVHQFNYAASLSGINLLNGTVVRADDPLKDIHLSDSNSTGFNFFFRSAHLGMDEFFGNLNLDDNPAGEETRFGTEIAYLNMTPEQFDTVTRIPVKGELKSNYFVYDYTSFYPGYRYINAPILYNHVYSFWLTGKSAISPYNIYGVLYLKSARYNSINDFELTVDVKINTRGQNNFKRNIPLKWEQVNSGLMNTSIQALATSATNSQIIYCGTNSLGKGAGVYKSTNAGNQWIQVNNGIVETTKGIKSIAVDPTNPDIAYIAVFDDSVDSQVGLYKTTNGGNIWNPSNNGIGTIKNISVIIINPLNPNVLYCGTSYNISGQTGPTKIYKSIDAGESWKDISNGLPSQTNDTKTISCISISDTDTSMILAGLLMNTDSLGGMFVSTNGGSLWERRHNGIPNLTGTHPLSCIIKPGSSTEFFVGLGNSTNTNIGVYATSNADLSWTAFNNGTMTSSIAVNALVFGNDLKNVTLYAGGSHPTVVTEQGVFEYSWPTVGIGNINNSIPTTFELHQNYPNPFNPSTIISFSIPVTSLVKLNVYDITGRLIKVLSNEMKEAGIHNITFDGSGLSSGVYFYKLEAGNYNQTKRMIMIK